MHRGSKAVDRQSIAFDFPDPNSLSAVEVPHGRHAAADLPDNNLSWIGYIEFTYLIDLPFGPGTPQRLLLYASPDEDHALSPRDPGTAL
jgi:hypothetical protein